MYTISKIEKQLIKSAEHDIDGHFVAIACLINDKGIAYHAGLIISCNDGYFLFHYTGENVLFQSVQVEELYFHKSLTFILPEFCDIFLGHCQKIEQNANPLYCFFYNGSYYDTDGNYYSENQIPQLMTCVGFCINVIKGFIEADEYFEYKDWTDQNVPMKYNKDSDYIREMILKIKSDTIEVTSDMFSENLRRIMPSELLASAFLESIPIRKSDVDSIINQLEMAIKNKVLNLKSA